MNGYDIKGLAFSGMKCQFPRISQRVLRKRQQISTRLNGCASEKKVFLIVVGVSPSYFTWTRPTPIQGQREGGCSRPMGVTWLDKSVPTFRSNPLPPILGKFCGSTNEPCWSNRYSDQATAISVWGSNQDKKEIFYSLLRNVQTGFGVPPNIFNGNEWSCQGIKRSGRDDDYSLLYSGEVQNEWSYTSFPSVRFHWRRQGLQLFICHGNMEVVGLFGVSVHVTQTAWFYVPRDTTWHLFPFLTSWTEPG
jgi:hypothetical protein